MPKAINSLISIFHQHKKIGQNPPWKELDFISEIPILIEFVNSKYHETFMEFEHELPVNFLIKCGFIYYSTCYLPLAKPGKPTKV